MPRPRPKQGARRPVKERLADVLEDVLGFNVHPNEIAPNLGYWAHGHQDCYRWEATITVPRDRDAEYDLNTDSKQPWKHVYKEVLGVRQDHVMLYSWDKMSECVKTGVKIERDGLHVAVYARAPTPRRSRRT